MGHGDVMNAGKQLFARINTVKAEQGQAEKLDANEIAQAKAFGFSLFNLTNDMTEEEFVAQYSNVKLNNTTENDAFAQQERKVHAEYIKKAFNIKDPNIQIEDGETIKDFEERMQNLAINKYFDENYKPDFALDKNPPKNTTEEEIKYIEKGSSQKEEYAEPDPTMCRDPETHNW